MPGRAYSATNSYRYGFNGKENDNEVKGEGSQQDYGMRIYDPRVGRFLSVDPLTSSYPYYTPYQFAGNSPIWAIDLDGLEDYVVVKELYKKGATKKVSIQYTVKKDDVKSTINMQFKQLLGKNADGTEKLGTPLTEQKVVRIIRDANKKEKVEFAEDLNKEERVIKNQLSRNEISNPTNDAWTLTVNGEK
jgi:RHS repeat-associated protein